MRGQSLVAILGAAGVLVLAVILGVLSMGGEQPETAAPGIEIKIDDNPAALAASEAQEAESVAMLPGAADEPVQEEEEEAMAEPAVPQELLITETIREKLSDPVLRQGAHPDDIAAVEAFYTAHSGPALWLTSAGISPGGQAVLGEMGRAGEWGLDPSLFRVPPASYQPTLTDDQAATEIAISLAVLKYARAARGGLVEPSALSKIYDQSPTVRPPETVLTEISTASAPDTYLADLHPKHEQFTRLRQALLKAQTEADKERLKVNMDRWRWMPETLGETYVWLNIPEFMLHVVKDGKTAESEKIVVGSPSSPTPVLSADMTEIVFNPERVVPLSVIRRDVLPKLRESGGLFGGGATSILEQYQLTVNNRGRAIDPSKIDWDTVDLSKLTFVQAPGPTNILGKVQFLYPNDRDIYLHDTIIRSQLTRAVRAEGQSEPRVANPEKLAGVLLAESNGWSTAKASQAAAGGKRTVVKLDKPIPVHMTYFTVLVDDQGEVKTFGDVYKLDEIEEPDDAAAVSPPVAGSAPIPARKPGNGSLAASAP
jgi:murein L,D-transpeptidase YcbB/YkuD